MKRLLLLLCAATYAEAQVDRNITGGTFLTLGAGAREVALGASGNVISYGASSVFWNPALLGFQRGFSALFMHTEYFQGVRYENLAVSKDSRYGTFGFGATGLYLTGLERRSGPTTEPDGNFSVFDVALQGSYGKSLGQNVALGLSTKVIQSGVADRRASAFAFDLGTFYRLSRLSAAITLSDVGTSLTFRDRSSSLPAAFGVGAALSLPATVLSFSMRKPFAESPEVGVGIEYSILDALFLRTGYNSDLNDFGLFQALTFGAGFRVENVDLDYTFRDYDLLGMTHRLAISFEPTRTETKRLREEKLLEAELAKRMESTAESFFVRGQNEQKAGNLEGALADLEIALVWNPDYAEARSLYDKIEEETARAEAKVRLDKGVALYQAKNYVDAIAEFQAVLDADSANEMARKWTDASFKAMEQQMIAAAKKHKKNLETLSKHMDKGTAYYSRGRYSKAVGEWKLVLAEDPKNAEAKEYIAKANRKLEALYSTYISKAQANADARNWSKVAYYARKAKAVKPASAEAKALLAKARSGMQSRLSSLISQGIAQYNSGDLDKAENTFNRVLDVDPANATAKDYLSKIKSKRASGRQSAQQLYLKGVEAYVRDDLTSAIFYWKKTLVLDPTNTKAKQNIAQAQEKLAKQKEK